MAGTDRRGLQLGLRISTRWRTCPASLESITTCTTTFVAGSTAPAYSRRCCKRLAIEVLVVHRVVERQPGCPSIIINASLEITQGVEIRVVGRSERAYRLVEREPEGWPDVERSVAYIVLS
jgi:hypothetical protein